MAKARKTKKAKRPTASKRTASKKKRSGIAQRLAGAAQSIVDAMTKMPPKGGNRTRRQGV